MRSKLAAAWKKRSRRERLLFGTAAAALLLYLTYALALEGTLLDILGQRARLEALNAEYQRRLVHHQRLAEMRERLEGLERELAVKKGEERRLMDGFKERHHTETLLRELRHAAKTMPLTLRDLEMKTGIVSEAREYRLESVGPASGPPGSQLVKVDYTVNQVVLHYGSTFESGIRYMLGVMALPYAISLNSFEIERASLQPAETGTAPQPPAAAASPAPKGEPPLSTRLGIEIYYR